MSELETCPKCESKLPPRLSSGRIVCSKCGWCDRPSKDEVKPDIANEALTNLKGVLNNALDGAINRERSRIDNDSVQAKVPRNLSAMKGLGYAVIGLGFLTSTQFFAAGDRLSRSGQTLTDLRSQGGQTVSEAYYQEIGRYGAGFAFLANAMGLGSITISLGLGGLLISKK